MASVSSISTTPRYFPIPVDKLNYAPYQRGVAKAWVKKLTKAWDPLGCGVIAVSQRADGTYWVFDGQHRALAAQQQGITTLQAEVWSGLSLEQESGGFLLRNTKTKAMSSVSKYAAAVWGGDPLATMTQRILNRVGVAVRAEGALRARETKSMADILLAVKRDPVIAEATLGLLAKLDCAVTQALFGGMFYLLTQGGVTLTSDLTKRIIKVGAKKLHDRAIAAQLVMRTAGAKAWADGIRDELNKGRVQANRI